MKEANERRTMYEWPSIRHQARTEAVSALLERQQNPEARIVLEELLTERRPEGARRLRRLWLHSHTHTHTHTHTT